MKRKIFSLLLLVTAFFTFSSCAFFKPANQKSMLVELTRESEHMLVIQVKDPSKGATVLDAMERLKESELLEYETVGTMIVSIDGVANAADYSACWMLYTSDGECANKEWGTVEYDSQTYGSAVLGADALQVMDGELYIWVYETF